jgi:restriction system protein
VIAERNGKRGVFQCKLYQGSVGNSAVQQAFSAMAFYEANFAAVVSTARYTKGAQQAARATGVHLLHPDDLTTFS